LDFNTADQPPIYMSEHLVCLDCQLSFPELQPRDSSFNSPHGACPECDGLGECREFDEALVVPDTGKTLREGALVPFGDQEGGWHLSQIQQLAEKFRFSLDKPYKHLSAETRNLLLYGAEQEMMFIFE